MSSPSIFREQDCSSFHTFPSAMTAMFGEEWILPGARRFWSPNQWRIWSALMHARRTGRTVWIESNLNPGHLFIYVGEIEKVKARKKQVEKTSDFSHFYPIGLTHVGDDDEE